MVLWRLAKVELLVFGIHTWHIWSEIFINGQGHTDSMIRNYADIICDRNVKYSPLIDLETHTNY